MFDLSLSYISRDDAEYRDVAVLFFDGLTNEPTGFADLLDPSSQALRDASE